METVEPVGTPESPAGSFVPDWRGSQFDRRLLITGLSLLIVAILVYLLKEFAAILQQLLVAVFLAYLIVPIHNWLSRRGVSPLLAYAGVVAVLLLASYALGQVIYHSVEHLSENLPKYRDNLNNTIQKAIHKTPAIDRHQLERLFNSESEFFNQSMGTMLSMAGTFFGFLTELIVILVYLAFLLAEQSGFGRRIESAFDPEPARKIRSIIERINASISQYLALKTLINVSIGGLTTLTLWLYHVDYAFLWGILAFLLNYIPYLGSLIAVIPPVLLSLVQFENLGYSALVLLTLLVIHNGIGYFVEPRLTGHQLDLSPLVVLLALAFWGSIWGTVGMLLAIPLTVVIKTILENIPETRPFARMLSSG